MADRATAPIRPALKACRLHPGAAFGNWNDDPKKALTLFNKHAQTEFDIKVASLDALDAVRSKPTACARFSARRDSAQKAVAASKPTAAAASF